ncbi:spermidine/putrescine ABC transporter substrate-binding protein [Clostridiales Family XIII bacterium RF-744-FAT-WT-3]|uniref:Spermidine/putrescine ABC transporter substrate-binding protein n=1 Tax=Baileyella intestinalis TaxID=2606709 RepID=A0A6A8M9Y2_9FIRM|nr:spermidine/putrescine ABC transporter substrate-binding protein [Baileyella intestinalis]
MKKGIMLFVFAGIMAVVLTIARNGGSKSSGVLYVFSYGDYYDPAIVEEFEKETGIQVIQDTYDTAEELYPIIENNPSRYDVVCTSDYMIGKMEKEHMLAPLDKSSIPNLKNLDPKYMKKAEAFDPGNKYCVPHTCGTMGIIYNSKKAGDVDFNSWDALWNPEMKGQIVMPDSLRDAYVIGLSRRGYDINTENSAQVKEATADLMAQKPLVYKYANDSARDLVADGSAVAGVVWNGEYKYVKGLNKNAEFSVPKEGTEFYIDGWVVPAKAKNKENAMKWINFLSRGDIAYKNFEYLYYTIPNTAAYKKIDPEDLNNPAIFPTDETLARCHSLTTLSHKGDALYSSEWKKVKGE